MNIDDAIYDECHDYPGGIPALAARLEIAAPTLQNMADPKQSSHGWPLKRFRKLLAIAGTRPLDALCEENGGVFVHTKGFEGVSDAALLETYAKFCADFGDVGKAINGALADGKIVSAEVKAVRDSIYEMNRAGAELANRMEQLEEPDDAGR